MKDYSRKALVGDIGGTNARFAISDIDELTIEHFASLGSAEFGSLPEAIKQYLRTIPQCPSMVSLAIAGPVSEDSAKMTNLPWSFSRTEIGALTGAEHVTLVNDFEAAALALPHLTRDDFVVVKQGAHEPRGAKAIIGAGTGLGVAGLVRSGDDWVAVASEGGHISFAIADESEREIVRLMKGAEDFLAVEEVISGPGLVKLFGALSKVRGQRLVDDLTAPQVVKAALVNHDQIAREALSLFVSWLGRFAGDIALMFGARGGLYLGGGIAPHILPALADERFRSAFESKGRMSPFLEPISVQVVKTGADAGLRGAAVAMARQLAGY